jgi:hypothetical protein
MNKQRRLPTSAQDIILPHNRMLRDRGDQFAGVLVLRIAEHLLHTRALDNLPLVQNRNALAERRHGGEIV